MVDGDLPRPKPGLAAGLAIAVCVVAVLGLGIWPEPLTASALRAAGSLLAQR